MTDTDRIAALEREVAELKAYIRQLQQADTLPVWATARKAPGTPAPTSGIGNSFVTCPMCASHGPYWHNCLPAPLNNGGTS